MRSLRSNAWNSAMSDEHDELDAFARGHLPAQQNWTYVLETGDREAAPTLASFSVGRTTYEIYKELREIQRNSPSRRQRSRRHSIAEYRGGNSIAEATVPRRQQYRGVSNGHVGLAALPWVGGPANTADFMTQNSRVLTRPLMHGELNPETPT